MSEQLAQKRRSRRETRHLLSSPVNAKRLLDGIAQLNAGENLVVAEFDDSGSLVRIDN